MEYFEDENLSLTQKLEKLAVFVQALSKEFNRIISMRRMRMVTARLDMRLNEEIKAKAEKASALLGLKSLTEYVVRLIDNNATKVIAQHESITVENDIFDRFMSACEETRTPNKALLDAAAYTKKQGIK